MLSKRANVLQRGHATELGTLANARPTEPAIDDTTTAGKSVQHMKKRGT